MASAWGVSWGVSWGASWGDSEAAVVEEQAATAGGGAFIGSAIGELSQPFVTVVGEEQVTPVGGGTWFSKEQIEAYRRYLRELEEAQDRPRKERKRVERRIEETLRKAYRKATGQEKEVAAVVVAAVTAVAPAAVTLATKLDAAPQIDWRALRNTVGAIEQVLALLEQRIEAERAEALAEEEAVIMLLMAA